MLQLTKRTEYGLIALTHLAEIEGETASVREIAERFSLPKRLLAEVLKDLCRGSLVLSQRGATGGYSLAMPAKEVSLGHVVSLLEGRPTITSCESMGSYESGGCTLEPSCPIRSPIQRLQTGIWNLLQQTSLKDLTEDASTPAPARRSFTQ